MKWYREPRNSQMPHEVIGVTRSSTNTNIYSNCASDTKPGELFVGRTFSGRDGFGRIINCQDHPDSIVLHHKNTQITLRLQHLMKSLTLITEFASSIPFVLVLITSAIASNVSVGLVVFQRGDGPRLSPSPNKFPSILL